MAILRWFSMLWKSLFQRSRLDDELDDELREYLNGLIGKKIQSGQDPARARRDALIEMGGVAQVKADVERVRVGTTLIGAWHDMRFAFRSRNASTFPG